MSLPTNEELDIKRRLVRRRMAWVSFTFTLLAGVSIISSVLLHPDRADIAAALSVSSVVLTGLFTVNATIILGYLGFSVVEKIWKKE